MLIEKKHYVNIVPLTGTGFLICYYDDKAIIFDCFGKIIQETQVDFKMTDLSKSYPTLFNPVTAGGLTFV
jgi:hypothetical protein